MKQKILDALKTKFVGVKDEILDRIASKASKTITTDEELTTYIEGVTFQTIIDAESDRRATDATKNAVSNYEKKHNIKDGKPIEDKKEKDPPKKDDPDLTNVPKWAQAILDTQKLLQEEISSIKGEKVADNRKSKLDEVLKDAPEKIKARYEKDFSRYNFKDDADFEDWLNDTKTDVEGINNDFKTKSGIVNPPKTGKEKTDGTVSKLVQDRIDAQKAEISSSAIQG